MDDAYNMYERMWACTCVRSQKQCLFFVFVVVVVVPFAYCLFVRPIPNTQRTTLQHSTLPQPKRKQTTTTRNNMSSSDAAVAAAAAAAAAAVTAAPSSGGGGGGGGGGGAAASPPEKKGRVEPLRSFVEVPADHDFSIHNLPFGVFSPTGDPEASPRCGVAIGDHVLDLSVVADAGLLGGFKHGGCFHEPQLNQFMGMGKAAWRTVRSTVQKLLLESNSALQDSCVAASALLAAGDVRMHLPATVGDYTDFYSSREHATNVGTMFRGAANALQPNWLHLPVGCVHACVVVVGSASLTLLAT